MAKPIPIPLEQARNGWGPFLDRIENGEPVYIQPAGAEQPTIVGLPPDLYATYRAARKLPPAEPHEIARTSSTSYHVDWEAVPKDIPVISLDSRAGRSHWGTVHLRVKQGQHIVVLRRYPAPGRQVAVLVDAAWVTAAEQVQARTANR